MRPLATGPPKTEHGLRTVELDEDTVAVLTEHRQAQEFQRRSWGEAYRSNLDLVFPRADGSLQDPDRIAKRFGRVVRRFQREGLQIREICFHDLRHTHATLLLEEGFDARYVSERLGHDSVRTTLDLYGHVTSKRRQNAAVRIAGILALLEMLWRADVRGSRIGEGTPMMSGWDRTLREGWPTTCSA